MSFTIHIEYTYTFWRFRVVLYFYNLFFIFESIHTFDTYIHRNSVGASNLFRESWDNRIAIWSSWLSFLVRLTKKMMRFEAIKIFGQPNQIASRLRANHHKKGWKCLKNSYEGIIFKIRLCFITLHAKQYLYFVKRCTKSLEITRSIEKKKIFLSSS